METRIINVGPDPNPMVCPSCQGQIITKVKMKATPRTHIMALLLCVFLCWPCVCVPYCMKSCNNVDHYCPSCNAYLGSYRS